MLVPRIFHSIKFQNIRDISNVEIPSGVGLFVFTKGLDLEEAKLIVHKVKLFCLASDVTFLVDDLRLAATVNAPGVLLPYGSYDQGRARDILGEDKLIGSTAHRIEEVAEIWEDGLSDFVILESYQETDNAENILGKARTQSILDDARIMGYDIPVLLAGGIDGQNAQELIDMSCYGLVVEDINELSDIQDYMSIRPLK